MDTRRIRELADTTSLSRIGKTITNKKNAVGSGAVVKKKMPAIMLNSEIINALLGKAHDVKLPEALLKAKELCDEFTIDVRNCGITSVDGYGSKASNVRTLDVSFNRLSDLDRLEGLKQLREIKAHNNMLGPELMDSYVFDGTPNVEVVYLNGNNLVCFPSCLRVLRKLRELRLNTNIMEKLTPGILKLSACRNLEFVDLGGNQLNSLAGLEALGGSLKTLILRNNNLKELHKSVGQLPLLEELDLGANRLTSLKELTKLCNKMNINILRVDHNRLSDWKTIPRLDSLSEFHAANNRFTHVEPIIAKFRNIDVIDIGDNRISEEGDVFSLQRVKGLVSLTLGGNPISHSEKIAKRLCKSMKSLAVYDGHSVARFGGDDTFEPPGLPVASSDSINENKENSKGSKDRIVRRKNQAKHPAINVATGKVAREKSNSTRRRSSHKEGKNMEQNGTDKTSTFGDDRSGVESLFSDRSIHAPSRQSAIVSSSASSAVSFTRSLAEKIFENDDEDDEKLPRPTPRMLSSRRSRSMLGGVNGYNNTGIKPLEDVDSLIESYRKKIQHVQKHNLASIEAAASTSSRPSTASSTTSVISKSSAVDPIISQPSTSRRDKGILRKDSTEFQDPNVAGMKIQSEKSLPKASLAEALRYARSATVDEGKVGCDNVAENEGKKDESLDDDIGFNSLKLSASDDSIVEGKYVEESVSKEDDLEETPIVTAKNNLLDQVRSDRSKSWKPPSSQQKRGFRGFKIPKRAKDYVHTHLEKK